MDIPDKYSSVIMDSLPEYFEYHVLKRIVEDLLEDRNISKDRRMALEEMSR